VHRRRPPRHFITAVTWLSSSPLTSSSCSHHHCRRRRSFKLRDCRTGSSSSPPLPLPNVARLSSDRRRCRVAVIFASPLPLSGLSSSHHRRSCRRCTATSLFVVAAAPSSRSCCRLRCHDRRCCFEVARGLRLRTPCRGCTVVVMGMQGSHRPLLQRGRGAHTGDLGDECGARAM